MNLRGLPFTIQFLGCRVNAAEAEALTSSLITAGAYEDRDNYELAIIVTCGVTSMADRKSRQTISRLRRKRPDACILACGCWAQEADLDQARDLGVDILVGNRQKGQILRLVAAFEGAFEELREGLDGPWDPLIAQASLHHSRALVKVQEGCNCRCSYCAVPLLRGPSVSRPIPSVVEECQRLIDSGAQELVLTGVHLGLWGKEIGKGLQDLVKAVGFLPGLKRLRFGSLEPFGVSDKLLEQLANTPTFAPHLHLPLQSGSPRIARAMRRPGGPKGFIERVKAVRRILGPEVHISTDALVAFPGEREEDFLQTLEVLEQCRIGRVHPFIFSPRPGTDAADMLGQVPREVAADRLTRLISWGEEALQREANRWVGKPNEVFIEREGKGLPRGHNDGWIEVLFPPDTERGRWVTVTPAMAQQGCLLP